MPHAAAACERLTNREHLGSVQSYLRTTAYELRTRGLGAPQGWAVGRTSPSWVLEAGNKPVTACFFGPDPVRGYGLIDDATPGLGTCTFTFGSAAFRWVTDDGTAHRGIAGGGHSVTLPKCPLEVLHGELPIWSVTAAPHT